MEDRFLRKNNIIFVIEPFSHYQSNNMTMTNTKDIVEKKKYNTSTVNQLSQKDWRNLQISQTLQPLESRWDGSIQFIPMHIADKNIN